jgi:hypothetical protein
MRSLIILIIFVIIIQIIKFIYIKYQTFNEIVDIKYILQPNSYSLLFNNISTNLFDNENIGLVESKEKAEAEAEVEVEVELNTETTSINTYNYYISNFNKL